MRSRLEEYVAAQLKRQKIKVEYEPFKLDYVIPSSKHKYTTDFLIVGTNKLIEVKGKLDAETRKKMLLIKEQHPEWQICFIFGRASNKLSKNSKTTYAMWADKNNFLWIDKTQAIPKGWLK